MRNRPAEPKEVRFALLNLLFEGLLLDFRHAAKSGGGNSAMTSCSEFGVLPRGITLVESPLANNAGPKRPTGARHSSVHEN
jgi:hypothetical protein